MFKIWKRNTTAERGRGFIYESDDVWPQKFLKPRFFVIGLTFLVVLGAAAAWQIAEKKAERWRAVFLSNNQVYFGHFLWLPFSSTIKLSGIYYLQTNVLSEQSSPGGAGVKLVKFGSEAHGPTDKMVILKNQIIFWEDLRNDSAVVQGIKNTGGL